MFYSFDTIQFAQCVGLDFSFGLKYLKLTSQTNFNQSFPFGLPIDF